MAADDKVANAEAQLQATLYVIPAHIWYALPSGALTFVNERTADYLGLPKDHPLRFGIDMGAEWDSHIPLLHPDDREDSRNAWSTCLRTGRAGEFRFRVRDGKGEYRWFLSRTEPLRASDGTILYWIGVNLDIDDAKRAEEALQQSQFYLTEGQRLTQMGSWAFNAAGFEYWSPELFRIHGLDPARKAPTVQEYLDILHPQDRESMANLIKGILANASPFDATKRIIRPNGEVRYIRYVGTPVVENGTLQRIVGTAIDFTDHELLTQEFRRREAYLAEAQRLSHTGSVGMEVSTKRIFWSEESARIYGYAPGTEPTPDLILQRVHPDDVGLVKEAIDRAGRGGDDFSFEHRLLMPDGSIKHIYNLAHFLRDKAGNKEVVGVIMDITERRIAEQAIRRSETYLAEAQGLSHTGSFGWKPDSGEIVWSDESYRIFEYDRSEKPSLDMVFQRIHPQDRALAQQVIDGVSRSTDFEHEYRLVMPSGAIKHIHVRAHALPDSSGNIEVVGAVTDITERKTAEEALRSSEAYLAEAQRLSQTGSWAWNFATAEITHWSEECCRIFGFEPGEPLPPYDAFLQRIYSDDQIAFSEQSEKAIRERADFEMDYRILHPKRGIRNIHAVGHPTLGPSGDIREFVGTVIDITERKTSEMKIRRLVDANILGIFIGNFEGAIIEANDPFLSMVQYGREDVLSGRVRWADLTPAEWRERDQRALAEIKATGIVQPYEKEYFRKDGSRVPVMIGGALFEEGGNDVVAFVLDLSQQKVAQEALRTSEAYLAEAQRMSHTGSWATAATGEPRYCSEEWYRLLGFDPAEHPPLLETVFQRIHPDDRAAIQEQFGRAIRDKADFELDMRVVHPITGVRSIRTTGHAVLDQCGDLREMVGTIIDITERQAAEQKIREQEMELRQILDFASLHVAVLGADGKAIYLNKAGLDYHGLTFEVWQNYDPHRLIHPDDHDRILTGEGGAKLLGDQPFETEARLVRKDGKCRWFLFRFNPLREGEGRITRWYVTATDIDDRKRAEEKLQLENAALREEIDQTSMFEEIVGNSPALQSVLSRICKVAPSDSTVLITGETGTGKELVARAIHRRSQRSGLAFVSVNCAAIPRDLVASELFGHEKGAFTGATQRRLGRFEMADGGTIFLDEVGELSPDTQVALLRVLQEREFERVGGGQPIHVDVRVIAATNRDLQAAVSNGTFRQDLYYRLNVFPIEVPPLRERKDDILMLLEYFAQRYASRAGKTVRSIEKKTLDALQSYQWPGNIRELQNVIERSVILSSGEVLSVDELWLSKDTSRAASRVEAPALVTGEGRAEPLGEREIIEAALAESRGRIYGPSGAAAKLGISTATLDRRIKALKIYKNRFKLG